MDIYKKLLELREAGKAIALVTVIDTRGSTPREKGAKMLVEIDGTIHGTIGGSAVEAKVIEEAKESIRSGKLQRTEHDLNDPGHEDTGMICGGKMTFMIEPLGSAPHLFIFGGGHVAFPLANLARTVGFDYSILEDRKEFANRERFPDARDIILKKAKDVAADLQLGEGDYVAIVTRSHEDDFQALQAILDKPVRYIGLIGSKTKKEQIFSRLRQSGVSEKTLKAIHTPIGLAINAKTVEEIAVSIVAELIRVKNRGR